MERVIGLLTDSNAQLPAALRHRYAVEVVPFTIVVDGEPYEEGVDLDNETFYARLQSGATVSTAAPSPGGMVAAYERLAAAGATAVLAIHIGSSVSAAVNAARLAVASSPVPVEIVDTGTASFAVGCCVWAAGDSLAAGADLGEAAAAARRVAAVVGNVFVVGALDLAHRGGRLALDAGSQEGVPVLALKEGVMAPVGRAVGVEEAVEIMAGHVTAAPGELPLRVGVGHAVLPDVADRLAARLENADRISEVVRYDVGPSVGVHTGAGTVGAVFFPEAP